MTNGPQSVNWFHKLPIIARLNCVGVDGPMGLTIINTCGAHVFSAIPSVGIVECMGTFEVSVTVYVGCCDVLVRICRFGYDQNLCVWIWILHQPRCAPFT